MQPTNNHQSSSMKFRFKNIGPVKQAELELGDLTIIAGRNNTGKTYIAYTLYGFLKMWKAWSNFDLLLINEKFADAKFPDPHRLAKRINQEGHATFPLDAETFSLQRKMVIQELSRTFSKTGLPAVFSSQRTDFADAAIDVDLNQAFSNHDQNLEFNFHPGFSLFFKYDGCQVSIVLKKAKDQFAHSWNEVSYIYFLFLLSDTFPDPFIFSTERFGISLFYRELDFTKNQLVDLLQKIRDEKDRKRISPFLFIDKSTSRYALPIKDNIDYTRSIPDRSRLKSELIEGKLFDKIKDMMDGYYQAKGDDIRFISKSRKERRFDIPLYLASSSARGLSDLYFFLRHVAKKGHLVIIDEPESHLDTQNQILLARLLASFVHAGLKVLITTHSDYLIKEINNLVMLSRPFEDKNRVVKELGYKEHDFLEPESIRAYVAEKNSLSRCKVDKFGIEMPIFDTTIDAINRASNELASRLSHEGEN